MKKNTTLDQVDAWRVAETGYHPELNEYYETVFSLANGFMGVRGSPEEGFTGENRNPGTYLAGVYAHFAAQHEWMRTGFAVKNDKMIQTLDWIALTFTIGGQPFDLRAGKVSDYERVLDLRRGLLSRQLTFTDAAGRATRFEFMRFVSMARPAIGAIRCVVTPVGHSAVIEVCGHVRGRAGADAHWTAGVDEGTLLSEEITTSKIRVAAAVRLWLDGAEAAIKVRLPVGEACTVDKVVALRTSRDPDAKGTPEERAVAEVERVATDGFDALLAEHVDAWSRIWEERDVVIEGDPAAQQGIRFSIFQMEQCYSGQDDTLNIGARALSCLDHSGHYFWDTEVYMAPYYIWQAPAKARSLLVQRHRTLPQAVARAEQHFYRGAMYPWATIDGTESAMPWEYSQLQIHVNAAIPFGVWQYVAATGDREFLVQHGAELLMQTCRFWADRSFFAADGSCRIHCVTGPDEYTVAVDNDHYTNAIVRFVFRKAATLLEQMRREHPAEYRALAARLKFKPAELRDWRRRASAMRLPPPTKTGVLPQHETFMDMQPVDLRKFPEKWCPAYWRCPWERIIRLQFIKQPDVLLAMHLLAEEYTPKQMCANFDFYDPKTIHESSLGACIHAIIASAIGREKEAFDFYLRGARLDLDQSWTRGIRIANAAGAWQVIVNGFAGMRLSTVDETLSFSPRLPKRWKSLSFTLHYQGRRVRVRVDRRSLTLHNDGPPLTVRVGRRRVRVGQTATLMNEVPVKQRR